MGTKSFNWGIYACWKDIVGQENEALGEEQVALLQDRGYGTNGLSEVIEWTVYADYGAGEQQIASGVLPASGPIGTYMPALAANSDPVKFRIVANLPAEETDNAYQGSTMKLALGVMAWQTSNGAPAPTLKDVQCPWAPEEPEAPEITVTFDGLPVELKDGVYRVSSNSYYQKTLEVTSDEPFTSKTNSIKLLGTGISGWEWVSGKGETAGFLPGEVRTAGESAGRWTIKYWMENFKDQTYAAFRQMGLDTVRIAITIADEAQNTVEYAIELDITGVGTN